VLEQDRRAATNLRGALVEFIGGYGASDVASQHIRITVIFKAPTGEKAEADVQSEEINQSLTFIECNRYRPFGTVSDNYIVNWLKTAISYEEPPRSNGVHTARTV
jgi:hypothetical protein